jgi:hypothetical protein
MTTHTTSTLIIIEVVDRMFSTALLVFFLAKQSIDWRIVLVVVPVSLLSCSFIRCRCTYCCTYNILFPFSNKLLLLLVLLVMELISLRLRSWEWIVRSSVSSLEIKLRLGLALSILPDLHATSIIQNKYSLTNLSYLYWLLSIWAVDPLSALIILSTLALVWLFTTLGPTTPSLIYIFC